MRVGAGGARGGVSALPKAYEINGSERLRSELISLKALNDRQLAEFMATQKKARAGDSNLEMALRQLLSYR